MKKVIAFVFIALMPLLAQAKGYILTADRIITGTLETAIDTAFPGTAALKVSENVFGDHSRNILIPRDSRLICDYQGVTEEGFPLVCTCILAGRHPVAISQTNQIEGSFLGQKGGRAIIAQGFIVKGTPKENLDPKPVIPQNTRLQLHPDHDWYIIDRK